MHRISIAALSGFITVMLGVCAGTTARAVPVPCNGGTLAAGQTAVLGTDADCGLVFLAGDATLDLNGHTFTGLIAAPDDGSNARFTIRGPGAIVGQGYPENPCVMFYRGRVLIDGGAGQVTLQNCGYGVLANHGGGSSVTLQHVTIKRTIAVPVLAAVEVSKVSATDVTIDLRDTLDIIRGHGINARRIEGSGIVLRHTARGLTARVVKVSDVTADDTQAAVAGAHRADLTRFTSTRHNVGVYGRKVRLRESALSNANPGGIDIGTTVRPQLIDTTCEHSAHFDEFGPGLSFGAPWGVCSLD